MCFFPKTSQEIDQVQCSVVKRFTDTAKSGNYVTSIVHCINEVSFRHKAKLVIEQVILSSRHDTYMFTCPTYNQYILCFYVAYSNQRALFVFVK
jgi:hypothetical protein